MTDQAVSIQLIDGDVVGGCLVHMHVQRTLNMGVICTVNLFVAGMCIMSLNKPTLCITHLSTLDL